MNCRECEKEIFPPRKIWCSETCSVRNHQRRNRQKYYQALKNRPGAYERMLANWRDSYQKKKEYHHKRALDQYWREKEMTPERLREKNRKAKSRQRFGVDSREEFIRSRGGVCENCGRDKSLVIHHIDHQGRNVQNKGKRPNNDISNLMVLCKSCHTNHHKYGAELKMKT